jgi:dolichol kinase
MPVLGSSPVAGMLDETVSKAAKAGPEVMEAVWPELSNANRIAMIVINVGAFVFAYILLRIIWKPPTKEQLAIDKEMHKQIEKIQESYGALAKEDCIEGEVMGDYEAPWTSTFDLSLVIFMAVTLVIMIIWTSLVYPELWSDPLFWIMQFPKVAVMMAVAVIGGITCRYFCAIDDSGYITTSKHSVFKVNYTRKFQHFAAYMVPLVIKYKSTVSGPIIDAWGDWFTMVAFMLLIKPVRENCSFFMLQFNSLDRPEDRPNTLKWIIAGNILPGLFMIIFWRWLLGWTDQVDLAFIFVFITGIGDGVAEPVGIWTGKHKYWTAALGSNRRYQRSLEGSSCLFIGSLLFTTMFWYAFQNQYQYWITMIILPPLMTWAEAVSPHTMDTPFLMGLGGLVVFLVSHVVVGWD